MSYSQMSMDDAPQLAKNPNGKEPRWDENIPWFQFPDDNSPHAYRLVARPFFYATHWVETRKKDGTAGKPMPVVCSNYDSATMSWAQNGCEVCNFLDQVRAIKDVKYENWPQAIKKMSRRLTLATNAIVREIQEQGAPSNNQAAWTYIRALRLPQGFADTVADKQEKFNKVAGQVYSFGHKDHGRDLLISYDSSSKEPSKQYQLDLGDKAPLNQDELNQAKFLINFAAHLKYPNQANLRQSMEQFKYYEMLEGMMNGASLSRVVNAPSAAAPAPQSIRQAAPAPAPVAAPVQASREQEAAFADGGTMQPTLGNLPQRPVEDDVPMGTVPKGPTSAAPAPQQPTTAAPAPVVGQTVPASGDKFANFTAQYGVAFAVPAKSFPNESDMRTYKPGLAVPVCFSGFNEVSMTKREQCRACPVRLDCMIGSEG